jgi:hypothetical protein
VSLKRKKEGKREVKEKEKEGRKEERKGETQIQIPREKMKITKKQKHFFFIFLKFLK